MPAGLINIVSYGANDLYLTGSPQITVFKIIYRRYTNFAKESIALTINDLDFDTSVDIEIPKIGDLVTELYVQIQLPAVSFLKSSLGIDISDISTSTYLTNYTTVVNFMKVNVAAYRQSYSDAQVVDLPPSVLIGDVINIFSKYNSSPELITSYRNLLSDTNSTLNYDWLYPNMTDISEIVNEISSDLTNNPNSWTNDQIMNRLETAIQQSIQVQGYYYDLLLNYDSSQVEQKSANAKFAWVHNLGHSIIDYVSVTIGGETIDKHYGTWIDVWHSLTENFYQQDMYNKLIGNVTDMTTFNSTQKPSYLITVPLKFWFCKNNGLALPLIALKYNQVGITLKLKKIEDCAYIQQNTDQDYSTSVSLTDLWEDSGFILNGTLLVDYVFLDTLERKRFAQSAHEYLIEKTQYMLFTDVEDQKMTINLDFRSPCKELIITAQKTAYINNYTSYYKSLWSNYSLTGKGVGNIVTSGEIQFNSYTRLQKVNGSYLNYVQPYSCHTNTPRDGINVYSFGIYPEEYQPSGSCNLGRISNATLYLSFDSDAFYYEPSDIDPSIPPPTDPIPSPWPAVWIYSVSPYKPDVSTLPSTTLNVRIFTTAYNILRIIGGFGALAYY